MLKHIVLLKFKEDADAAELQAMREGMDGLQAKVPQLVSFNHGADAGVSPGAFDYAVVAEFASAEDYATYIDHPEHRAVGAHVVAVMADAAQIQFHS